jgi:hypothetical protein
MLRKIILLLAFTFLFIQSTHAEEKVKTTPTPVQNVIQNNTQPTTNQVYEALIESKNVLIEVQKEKIEFLNNLIGWIFAGLGILVTLIIIYVSYIYRKNLKEIETRSKQLQIQHNQIREIADSKAFKNNLEQLQSEVSKYDEKTQSLDQKVLELEKTANNLRDAMQSMVLMNWMDK